jgi:hypothetical protein
MRWTFNASCGHHDFGYIAGGGEFRRLYCDFKFGSAMIEDLVDNIKTNKKLDFVIGVFMAIGFFLTVVLLGWTSYNYGRPKTKSGVLLYVKTSPKKQPGLFKRLSKFRFY